jgi:hypothetical protein
MQERDPGAVENLLHSDASSDSFPLTDERLAQHRDRQTAFEKLFHIVGLV